MEKWEIDFIICNSSEYLADRIMIFKEVLYNDKCKKMQFNSSVAL